jgi:thiol:disulfide interchange protein
MSSLPVLTEIRDRAHFAELLGQNPGKIVIKFGAEWCAPCKAIEQQVHDWIENMPETVQCIIVDIDECFDIYAFLKTKKMVNGIPAILCYNKGNVSYIPDDSVIGADKQKVDAFFQRCLE